jgi:dTDP-4-dehydrorhamnose 3,5-epimerase
VVVPPGVWHAVQNLAPETSTLLNLVDHAYDYEKPDHWRLPIGTPLIPYSFRPAMETLGKSLEEL